MKTKLLLLLAISFFAIAGASQAGGRCGWGGGGGWRGGYCGPGWGGGWGGWGGGWWGPSFGISFINPAPVYRTVYVAQPAPVYVTRQTTVQVDYAQPTLARAQVRLARLGYYPGSIDGNFGPMTSQALRTYQADYGLPVTGRLDRRTIASLGV